MTSEISPTRVINLIAKTKKAREWIRQHGGIGPVMRTADQVAFSSERGPWLLVVATDVDNRWITCNTRSEFRDLRIDVITGL